MSGRAATASDHFTTNRDVPRGWRRSGAFAGGAVAVSATAVGAAAIGAVVIGTLAIGALAIRRLAVRRPRARSVVIDQLVVNRLIVRSSSLPVRDVFEPGGQGSVAQGATRRSMNGHGARSELRARSMSAGDQAAAGTVGTGELTCPVCGGAGLIDTQRCTNCDGTGKVVQAVGGG